MQIPGIHHVTAIASDPQTNVDFYVGLLGLRLVKQTVNFDDPATYHLYYGDQSGSPGTILTFFPWRNMPRGRAGAGETSAITFRVPAIALAHWEHRLRATTVDVQSAERFGKPFLAFRDPDGLPLEITGVPLESDNPSILGFDAVTLSETGFEATAQLLTEQFRYELRGNEGNRYRYEAPDTPGHALGRAVDLLCQPDRRHAELGAGSVHHVAFRAETPEVQLQWRTVLSRAGRNVTPVLDRQYFHSIYFREPGGVLFEIATDPPGFAIDEAPEALGTSLRLPPWLEPERREVESLLPKLRLPEKHLAV